MAKKYRAYGFTGDGGGFPCADGSADNLNSSIGQLVNGFSRGSGWIEVVEDNNVICHLVYDSGNLTKIHQFTGARTIVF